MSEDLRIAGQRGAIAPDRRSRRRASALGTTARTVSGGSRSGSRSCSRTRTPARKKKRTPEEEGESRVQRFALQSESARLLPKERVAECLRQIVPLSAGVAVQHTPSTKSAHYSGLKTCASVWHCPVCAAKISERRRIELQQIIEKHIEMGGSVYMTTYTISHKRYDDLQDLLQRFLEARRKAKAGRRGQALKTDFQICGTVSVLEVTWSEANGWHPHVHELVFCMLPRMDEENYEITMRQAWEDAAAREGLSMNMHGFKLDRTYGAVGDYIAKFGREPALGNKAWGVEAEMTKGHTKRGRIDEHYTPFALLAAVNQGREDLKPIFVEYARCFKGRKQLTYSPHLKSFYNLEEKSDEELAAEVQEEAVTLVMLTPGQWAQVVGNDIRGELLEVARSGDALAVIGYLEGFGIEGVTPITVDDGGGG
jgi:hypothetical protein